MMKREKRIHPTILVNLKRLGYTPIEMSNEEVISVLKKEYYVDLDINYIMKHKSSYIPLIPKNKYVLYVLFDNDEIVYVGMSKSLILRIGYHQSDKTFNYVYVVEVNQDIDIKAEEFKYICRLYPKYNAEVKNMCNFFYT